jgi:hypothetical protein
MRRQDGSDRFDTAVAYVAEADVDVPPLEAAGAVLVAMQSLSHAGFRLVLIHPGEVLIRRREERRRWWRPSRKEQ